MASETVERHLANWADWQRNSSTNLGYPKRAAVAMGGGQSIEGVFQEICDSIDAHSAEVMEALVSDLPINFRSAIYHHWLGCIIRVRYQEKSLSDAYIELANKMSKRGLY